MGKLNKHFLCKEFIFCTVVPFILPFIDRIPDNVISGHAKIVLIFIFFLLDVIYAIKYYNRKAIEKSNHVGNKLTREAYSNAFELSERKRDYLINRTYHEGFSIPKEAIPYDVHDYIGEICKNFRNTISQITSISKEHMAVTFIYRYIYNQANAEDKKWRWVVGKETTNRIPLDDFVGNPATLYYYLINNNHSLKSVNCVFCNDKHTLESDSHYFMSTRDEDHNKKGSVFAVKIIFGNNAESFVESILMISTYGKNFIEKNISEYSEAELKNLLTEELFPYYQRLLEAELGILYLRHIANR